MAPTKSIAVIGSLNVDFITRAPRIPAAGETLTAHSFSTGFGGKGANQAVACARLADPHLVAVRMVGNVGDDSFGTDYHAALQSEGIDISAVRRVRGERTGVANILVDDGSGENRILLATNANHAFSKQRDAGWDLLPASADVVVFQLEIPLNVVLHNIHEARRHNKHVLLNPAPALALPESVFRDIDTLILNETESAILAGPEHKSSSPEDLASLFLRKGVRDAVVVTLGGDGLVYATSSGVNRRLPAHSVRVVDTTAAGDTFVGAYAIQLVQSTGVGFDHEKALEFATFAASKTVGRKGAMDAIPYRKEMERSS